jgi:hypothetical protein
VYVCFADFSHTPPSTPFSVMSQFVSDTLAGCVWQWRTLASESPQHTTRTERRAQMTTVWQQTAVQSVHPNEPTNNSVCPPDDPLAVCWGRSLFGGGGYAGQLSATDLGELSSSADPVAEWLCSEGFLLQHQQPDCWRTEEVEMDLSPPQPPGLDFVTCFFLTVLPIRIVEPYPGICRICGIRSQSLIFDDQKLKNFNDFFGKKI